MCIISKRLYTDACYTICIVYMAINRIIIIDRDEFPNIQVGWITAPKMAVKMAAVTLTVTLTPAVTLTVTSPPAMTNIDTSKTEYRYIENRISIYRKPNIDTSKTEYRYIENRISIHRKNRISIYRKPNIDISKSEYRCVYIPRARPCPPCRCADATR